MQIVFVSYGSFSNNSFYHIAGFASGLTRCGHDVLLVADGEQPQHADFLTLSYQQWEAGLVGSHIQAILSDPASLFHAWTPRRRVQMFVEEVAPRRRADVVHLEDDEVLIAQRFLGDSYAAAADLTGEGWGNCPPTISHPVIHRRLMDMARAVTVISPHLRRHAPATAEVLLLEPGVDPEQFRPPADVEEKAAWRRSHGFAEDEFVIGYSGNIHPLVQRDLFSLFRGVALVRSLDRSVVLARTGAATDVNSRSLVFERAEGVRMMGWLARGDLARAMGAVDMFVQPGWDTPFNLSRFPSKLPEFLALGNPLAVSERGFGARLTDGENAVLMKQGGGPEIARAIRRVMAMPDRGRGIGLAGRRFAQSAFDWNEKVASLTSLYERTLDRSSRHS